MHTLETIAREVEGRLDGPADLTLADLVPLDLAGPTHLVFATQHADIMDMRGSHSRLSGPPHHFCP